MYLLSIFFDLPIFVDLNKTKEGQFDDVEEEEEDNVFLEERGEPSKNAPKHGDNVDDANEERGEPSKKAPNPGDDG